MQLRLPDPVYTASRRAGSNFLLAFRLVLGFVLVMWSVFLFDQFLELGLIQYGLRPRESFGLLGLLTTPLLHYNLAHIGSNTLPLLIGGTMLLFLYPNASLRVMPALYFGTSLLAWIFARSSIHIGASGLIYGLLAFVFVSGVIRRDFRSIGAALLVWFLYGSMLWGVLPLGPNMSWELHVSGFLIGVLLAWLFRHWDQPPMKRYDWEDEAPFDPVRDEPWRDPGFDELKPPQAGADAESGSDDRWR